MRKPVRRVVTGQDASGRSVFIMDGAAPHVYSRSRGSAEWRGRRRTADERLCAAR